MSTREKKGNGTMLRAAIGLQVGVAGLIVGQTEPVVKSFPYADLVVQGGALAVLTWAVYHAYKNVIPGLRKELGEDRARYMESLDKSREAFSETLDVMGERHERIQKETSDRHERWEAQRHEDSEKLREALVGLAVTCAESRASTLKQLQDRA